MRSEVLIDSKWGSEFQSLRNSRIKKKWVLFAFKSFFNTNNVVTRNFN